MDLIFPLLLDELHASERTVDLFISHMWRLDDNAAYHQFEQLLKSNADFKWRNLSAIQFDPLGNKSEAQLRSSLRSQICASSCFVLLSDMFIGHQKWIREEIDIAKSFSKPIIGITPRTHEPTPPAVKLASKQVVGWDPESIVNAIKRWG